MVGSWDSRGFNRCILEVDKDTITVNENGPLKTSELGIITSRGFFEGVPYLPIITNDYKKGDLIMPARGTIFDVFIIIIIRYVDTILLLVWSLITIRQ